MRASLIALASSLIISAFSSAAFGFPVFKDKSGGYFGTQTKTNIWCQSLDQHQWKWLVGDQQEKLAINGKWEKPGVKQYFIVKNLDYTTAATLCNSGNNMAFARPADADEITPDNYFKIEETGEIMPPWYMKHKPTTKAYVYHG